MVHNGHEVLRGGTTQTREEIEAAAYKKGFQDGQAAEQKMLQQWAKDNAYSKIGKYLRID